MVSHQAIADFTRQTYGTFDRLENRVPNPHLTCNGAQPCPGYRYDVSAHCGHAGAIIVELADSYYSATHAALIAIADDGCLAIWAD